MSRIARIIELRLTPNQIASCFLSLCMIAISYSVHANDSLEGLIGKVIVSEGGDIGPTICGFCSNSEFEELVSKLPSRLDDVPRYILSTKSTSRLYVLGIAAQRLKFDDFISTQEMVFNEWRRKNISDETFEVLVFRPMVFSRRLMILHNNQRVSKLIKEIKEESIRRGGNKAFNSEFFKKLESGYYRRYALSHKDIFDVVDDDSVANYQFLEKSKEILLQGFVPLLLLSTMLGYLSLLMKRKGKTKILIMTGLSSVVSAIFAMLFYLGVLVV